jgi:protoheme IX farnesyltransferase
MTRTLDEIRNFAALTKPRILPMVLFTGLPPFAMATQAISPLWATWTLLGIALAGAAANTLNCYVERDRDALMERTRERPLPSEAVKPRHALVFGLALSTVATAILLATGGVLAAGIGVASILFYVFVYTVWLKPRSIWNAVVGGASGAVAPLIADAAVDGHIGAAGWLLFAIIFFWQPPHVWAIALYRRDDYAAAGIPVPPNVIGAEATRWQMLRYTLALLPVTLAPVALGLLGTVYLSAALVLGAWFTWHVVRVLRERSDESARRAFRVSLLYLFGLFSAMLLELFLT